MKRFRSWSLLVACCVSLASCSGTPEAAYSSVIPGSSQVSSEASAPVTDGGSGSILSQPPSSAQDSDDAQKILEKSQHLVGLNDQLNGRIIVCDLAVEDWSDDKAVVWETKVPSGGAGVKFRDNAYWGGEVVLYCSGTKAGIISYATKEVLFETNDAARNAHSVELLPSGALVVASSTGGEVRIFAPGNPVHADAVAFVGAHGALWDPKYDVLWLSGDNILQAYRVGGTADAPTLSPVEGKRYFIRPGLHDLAPVYGNPDALFLTSSSGIVLFDKTTGKVSYNYQGGDFGKTQTYVPGVGNYGQDNVLVFTTVRSDTLVYEDWGTNQVGIFVPLGEKKGRIFYRKAPNDAYYKVRVWDTAYQ